MSPFTHTSRRLTIVKLTQSISLSFSHNHRIVNRVNPIIRILRNEILRNIFDGIKDLFHRSHLRSLCWSNVYRWCLRWSSLSSRLLIIQLRKLSSFSLSNFHGIICWVNPVEWILRNEVLRNCRLEIETILHSIETIILGLEWIRWQTSHNSIYRLSNLLNTITTLTFVYTSFSIMLLFPKFTHLNSFATSYKNAITIGFIWINNVIRILSLEISWDILHIIQCILHRANAMVICEFSVVIRTGWSNNRGYTFPERWFLLFYNRRYFLTESTPFTLTSFALFL